MAPGLVQGGERAQRAPAGRGNSLAPLLDVPALERASRRQRAAAAVGVEGITQEPDGQSVEAHLQELYARRQAKRYRHQPLRRVHLATGQGTTRPLGLSACEDPGGPDAGREVLEASDEQAFLACSYGVRPGRSAHDAGRPLKRMGEQGAVRGSFEAAIVSVCASMDRPARKKRREVRGADGARLRRIGPCLHVGVLDGATRGEPEVGSAQGAVRSPLGGNVSLP
jgi:RNA-directed DNA polymerase